MLNKPINMEEIAMHIDRLTHLSRLYSATVQELRDLGVWVCNDPDGIQVLEIDPVAEALCEAVTETPHKPGWAFYRGLRRNGVRIFRYYVGKIDGGEET